MGFNMSKWNGKSYLDFDDLEDMFEKGWSVTARTSSSWTFSITDGDYAGCTVRLIGGGFSTSGDFPTSGIVRAVSVSQGVNPVFNVDGLSLKATTFAAEADIRIGGSHDQDEDEDEDRDDDLLYGGRGDDDVVGDVGDDRIYGHKGRDHLHGGSGRDHLDGGDDDDEIDGDSGDDEIVGGRGSDDLDGGEGHDSLKGGNDDDSVEGGGGNDRLDGNSGDDDFDGGLGDDLIVGGTGDDTVHYEDSRTAVSVDLGRHLGTGEGRDRLVGVEHVQGSGKGDRLYGDGSDNVLSGNGGRDRIQGLGGNDTLDGGGDRDELDGGDGNDLLTGGADADKLIGNAGDDRLVGGAGNDVLTGGSGNDVFVFSGEMGRDVVKDFADGDLIDLRDWAAAHGIASFDDLDGYLDGNGSHVVLQLANDSTVKLAGVGPAELSSDDFLF
jgi:Ca2+-binding RTX toxin-like protein